MEVVKEVCRNCGTKVTPPTCSSAEKETGPHSLNSFPVDLSKIIFENVSAQEVLQQLFGLEMTKCIRAYEEPLVLCLGCIMSLSQCYSHWTKFCRDGSSGIFASVFHHCVNPCQIGESESLSEKPSTSSIVESVKTGDCELDQKIASASTGPNCSTISIPRSGPAPGQRVLRSRSRSVSPVKSNDVKEVQPGTAAWCGPQQDTEPIRTRFKTKKIKSLIKDCSVSLKRLSPTAIRKMKRSLKQSTGDVSGGSGSGGVKRNLFKASVDETENDDVKSDAQKRTSVASDENTSKQDDPGPDQPVVDSPYCGSVDLHTEEILDKQQIVNDLSVNKDNEDEDDDEIEDEDMKGEPKYKSESTPKQSNKKSYLEMKNKKDGCQKEKLTRTKKPKIHACSICPRMCSSERRLQQHLRSHAFKMERQNSSDSSNGKKTPFTFQCDLCPAAFIYNVQRNEHMRRKHGEQRPSPSSTESKGNAYHPQNLHDKSLTPEVMVTNEVKVKTEFNPQWNMSSFGIDSTDKVGPSKEFPAVQAFQTNELALSSCITELKNMTSEHASSSRSQFSDGLSHDDSNSFFDGEDAFSPGLEMKRKSDNSSKKPKREYPLISCNECCATFKGRTMLQIHKKLHEKGIPRSEYVDCPECKWRFKTISWVLRHVYKEHGDIFKKKDSKKILDQLKLQQMGETPSNPNNAGNSKVEPTPVSNHEDHSNQVINSIGTINYDNHLNNSPSTIQNTNYYAKPEPTPWYDYSTYASTSQDHLNHFPSHYPMNTDNPTVPPTYTNSIHTEQAYQPYSNSAAPMYSMSNYNYPHVGQMSSENYYRETPHQQYINHEPIADVAHAVAVAMGEEPTNGQFYSQQREIGFDDI